MNEQLPMRLAGPLLALVAAVVGFAVHGLDGAVIWFVVAFFVGKSIESLLLTLRAGPSH